MTLFADASVTSRELAPTVSQVALATILFGLWLVTFRLRKHIQESGKPLLWSLVPALLPLLLSLVFTWQMKDQYLPAVFTLTILALIAAAEHLQTLEQVSDFQEVLGRRARHLLTIDSILARLKSLDPKLNIVHEHVERLSGYETKYRWRNELRKETTNAKSRVLGVIRVWDIDDAWLALAKEALPESPFHLWTRFHSTQLNVVGEPVEWPFLATLEPVAKRVLDGEALLDLRFVTDSPLGPMELGSLYAGLDAESKATFFEHFYGMTWQLTCAMYITRQVLGSKAPAKRIFKVRLGKCPLWFHVQDQEVWQVIRAEPGGEPHNFARQLTQGMRQVSDKLSLADAHAQIFDDFYKSAGRAEAYIASVFKVACNASNMHEQFHPAGMEEVIKWLGVNEWIEDKDLETVAPGSRLTAQASFAFRQYFHERQLALGADSPDEKLNVSTEPTDLLKIMEEDINF